MEYLKVEAIRFRERSKSEAFTRSTNILYSGIRIYYPTQLIGIFCSIINNNVTKNSNIMFQGNNNNLFSFSNIIKNNSPLTYGVITNFVDTYTISNCIFYNNKDVLFYVLNGKLNIINSIIEHLTILTSKNSGIISINNITNFLNFTFNINHLNTYYCKINNINYFNFIKKNNFKIIIFHLHILELNF